jgi:heme oxygenase
MHPSQVLGEIKKFLKNSVNSESFDEQEALARLAFVQLRALRHSRAGAKRIYGNELSIS